MDGCKIAKRQSRKQRAVDVAQDPLQPCKQISRVLGQTNADGAAVELVTPLG